MANEITAATEAAVTLPELWRVPCLKARYAAQKVVPIVLHADQIVNKPGDTVNVNIMPSVSVNDVGSGGSTTNQALTVTNAAITINKWKEATVDIEDLANIQSAQDLKAEFSAAFGKALAQKMDVDLLALYSELTSNAAIGSTTTPQPFDDGMARAARYALDIVDIPEMDRNWVLGVQAELDLLAQPRFSEAQNTGFSTGLQVGDGKLKGLYGYPVVVTSRVAASGSPSIYNNVFIHKEAWGIGIQKNFMITQFAKIQYSTKISGMCLYGVKTLRASHGVLIRSAAV